MEMKKKIPIMLGLLLVLVAFMGSVSALPLIYMTPDQTAHAFVSTSCTTTIYVGNYTLGTPAYIIDPGGLYVPYMPALHQVWYIDNTKLSYCMEAVGSNVIPAGTTEP